MDKQLILECLRMLRERRDYWWKRENFDTAGAYDSAADMLEYAINGDSASLYQFDYYG